MPQPHPFPRNESPSPAILKGRGESHALKGRGVTGFVGIKTPKGSNPVTDDGRSQELKFFGTTLLEPS